MANDAYAPIYYNNVSGANAGATDNVPWGPQLVLGNGNFKIDQDGCIRIDGTLQGHDDTRGGPNLVVDLTGGTDFRGNPTSGGAVFIVGSAVNDMSGTDNNYTASTGINCTADANYNQAYPAVITRYYIDTTGMVSVGLELHSKTSDAIRKIPFSASMATVGANAFKVNSEIRADSLIFKANDGTEIMSIDGPTGALSVGTDTSKKTAISLTGSGAGSRAVFGGDTGGVMNGLTMAGDITLTSHKLTLTGGTVQPCTPLAVSNYAYALGGDTDNGAYVAAFNTPDYAIRIGASADELAVFDDIIFQSYNANTADNIFTIGTLSGGSTPTAVFGVPVRITGLTASKVPYLDSNSQFAVSAVTPTELGYLSGVTSAIQTQLNAKMSNANTVQYSESVGTASGVATGTRAALSFGTTTPGLTLPAGKWKIEAFAIENCASSSGAAYTISYVIRRTNHSANDISTVTPYTNDQLAQLGGGDELGRVLLPAVNYTATAGDTIAIFASTPSDGPTLTKAYLMATPVP